MNFRNTNDKLRLFVPPILTWLLIVLAPIGIGICIAHWLPHFHWLGWAIGVTALFGLLFSGELLLRGIYWISGYRPQDIRNDAVNPKFTWGNAVQVNHGAPEEFRPDDFGLVCGLRLSGDGVSYLIKFADENLFEVPERYLEISGRRKL